jgi:hypothetical protein
MDRVADDDPGSIEELAPYAGSGRAFVAADATDQPIATCSWTSSTVRLISSR